MFAKGLVSYQKGFNHFTDKTYKEFASIYLGAHSQTLKNGTIANKVNISIKNASTKMGLGTDGLPDSIDWRNLTGVVGAIKNQGACG